MSGGPIGADSWMDVVAYAVVGIPALIAAVAAYRVAMRNAAAQKTIGDDIAAVREHTVNTHATNLRDDIDALRDAVDALADQVTQVAESRGDLAAAIVAVRGDLTELGAANTARFDSIDARVEHIDKRSARIGDEVRDEQHARIQLRKTVEAAVERAEQVIAEHHPGAK